MKIKHYLLIGFTSFILFLIIGIPASPIYHAIKDKFPQLQIHNINGTIWRGSAQQVTIKSRYILENVNWSICVTRLLIGEACVELFADYNDSPFSGQISVDLNQKIHGKNIKTSISANVLSQMITMPIGEIDGDVNVNLTTLHWKQGGVPAISGTILWNNASITFAETADLGNITITLNDPSENPINAEINNQSGQLAINGHASLNSNTDYKVNLKVIPRDNTSENIKNSLRLFAQPTSDGSFILKNSGNLKQLGLM